ncbi:MAG: hypothetical protein OEZ23_07885, partial [Gammaproteobacteria bacterium]|nr:hypothetical protein [Gammaproteobacteria bacterium]
FYLADYKSNYLGSDESAYLPASLETAMNEHNYKLQLIIYTVALHKYLSKNLLDYDYRVHFGGSFYLFLRGMNGNNQNGIYHNLPDWDLVQALEKLFEPKTEDIKND